ncbi:SigE family RNA polymerase sigma factor [Micromonosporaceae bacterium Da 78-11]
MGAAGEDFAEFVTAARTPLLKTARLLTGDWHLGQDLLQATLTKVYLRWGQADRWESPLAYTRAVMVNTYCSWYRRRWRHEVPHGTLPETLDTRGDPADAVAVGDGLTRALLELPRRHRAVLVLRYYEDLTVQQTATVLGCPPGTVTSLSARALARLRTSPGLRPVPVPEKARALRPRKG